MVHVFRTRGDRWEAPDGKSKPYLAINPVSEPVPEPSPKPAEAPPEIRKRRRLPRVYDPIEEMLNPRGYRTLKPPVTTSGSVHVCAMEEGCRVTWKFTGDDGEVKWSCDDHLLLVAQLFEKATIEAAKKEWLK